MGKSMLFLVVLIAFCAVALAVPAPQFGFGNYGGGYQQPYYGGGGQGFGGGHQGGFGGGHHGGFGGHHGGGRGHHGHHG